MVEGEHCWAVAGLAGALALAACLGVAAAGPEEAYWINDCGNKALVAERLIETGFRDAHLRPGLADPSGRWFAIPPPFALPHEGGFLSTYPPLFPALAALGRWVFGPPGLRLPAALGVGASALLFVLWAAPAAGRRWAFAGAMLLALGSPLFFYGLTVWEHSLTVALTLGACLLVARPGLAPAAGAGLVVGAACWLREEMALLALAFAVAALLARWPRSRTAAFAAGVALPGAALLAFNASYHGHPLGGHVMANLLSGDGGALGAATAGRLDPLAGLLGGFGETATERWLFALGGAVLPLAGFAWARPAGAWLAPLLAGAAVSLWAVALRRLLVSASPLQTLVLHNGLLLQWPMIALAGLGLRSAWRDPGCAPLRVGITSALLFALLVLAAGIAFPTDYGVQVGAGVHWGPRVLLPAFPAFVLLAVLAVRGRGRADLAAWGALAVAGLVSTGVAAALLVEQRSESDRVARELRSLPAEVMLTTHPFLPQHLAALWGEKSMLLASDAGGLRAAAAAALSRRGVEEILLVLPAGSPVVQLARVCRPAARLRARLQYVDLDVYRCR